jgi:hypothetical protein
MIEETNKWALADFISSSSLLVTGSYTEVESEYAPKAPNVAKRGEMTRSDLREAGINSS